MLLGMSQEKLGEKLGLTFQQVQKYEKGINRIGASRLFDLAQVLGVSVQFFYEEAPLPEPRAIETDATAADGQQKGPPRAFDRRVPAQPRRPGAEQGVRAHLRRQGAARDRRTRAQLLANDTRDRCRKAQARACVLRTARKLRWGWNPTGRVIGARGSS